MAADRHPTLWQTVLDTTDARALAEFYRQLLGYRYRPGDETAGPDGEEWLVLEAPDDSARLAFQQTEVVPRSTWPDPAISQQLHLDLRVRSVEELDDQHDRVLALGGRLIFDRSDDDEEPLRVYADPAGHPFCVFVRH